MSGVCANWVPIRWPAAWRDSSLLDLLQGTPLNCLVLKWDSDPPASLVEPARQRGLAVVAEIDPRAGRDAALASAQAAGVSAIALDAPQDTNLPAIAWAPKSSLPWPSPAAAFAFTDAVWPAIPGKSADTYEASPTGAAWVDSNGWFIHLARALGGNRPVWACAAPPEAEFIRAAQYALAIADASAYGARWPVTLDPKLAAGLRDRRPAARSLWNTIVGTLRFFERHSEWRTYAPVGNLAVVSDFTGANEFSSHEVLNLLPRRAVPYLIIEKARAGQAAFNGLQAILYPDEQPPDSALFEEMTTFAAAGGLIIAAGAWPAPPGVPPATDSYRRWSVYPVGAGRIAIAKTPGGDPFPVAADAQLLMGRRHDLLRMFNSFTLNTCYTASPDGNKAVLHVLNYALRPSAQPPSIALARRYKSARLWPITGAGSEPIEIAPSAAGIELHLPPFEVYAAVELEA